MPKPTHTVPSDLATISDAAIACRVHEHTIREWINRGIVTLYGRPKAYRVSLSDCMPIAAERLASPKPSRRTKRPGIGPQPPPKRRAKPSRTPTASKRSERPQPKETP